MSFSKKTILVVDGSKTLVLYMGIMLKRMGFNVVPADTGLEALKLMKMVTPDMVLLDSFLPSLDGLETLERIRRGAHTKEVPVVVMMQQEDEEFSQACKKAGCNGILPKPIPMDLLHEYIQDFIFSPLGFRRKHLRVQTDIGVYISWDEAVREFRTDAVSEGGVYVKTPSPFKVGTKVGVTLPYKESSIKLDGVVIYIKNMADERVAMPPGMAIEFRDVPARVMLTLNRLVSELIAGDITEADGRTLLTMPWQTRDARGTAISRDE
jgi:CheY-like chemotaxis protein/Tfp pilus assembly protein PilZ